MDKQLVIDKLTLIENAVNELRMNIMNEPNDKLLYPYFYKFPVTDLRLEGVTYPNRFFNACHKHMVQSIGQLIITGRASVLKWPLIGPQLVNAVAIELRERFEIEW